MPKTPIEEIKNSIQINKDRISQLKAEISNTESKIKYYEGRLDEANETLSMLEFAEAK